MRDNNHLCFLLIKIPGIQPGSISFFIKGFYPLNNLLTRSEKEYNYKVFKYKETKRNSERYELLFKCK